MTEMSMMEMPCGRAMRMSPPSLGANSGAVGRSACASSEAGKPAEGWLKIGGDARPVHSTAQSPLQDAIAQHKLCSEGGQSIECCGRCPYGVGWLCSRAAWWGH
jgi:hypothetical protein